MLKFRLNRGDLSRPWRTSPEGWSAGNSQLTPYRHPALEDFAAAAGDRVLFVVRERFAGAPPPKTDMQQPAALSARALEAVLAECLDWPLQRILVLIDRRVGALQIHSGSWGTAPVFALERDDSLWGDWDASALYDLARGVALEPALTAHFLIAFDCPYSRRTLIPDIQALTERTTAHWGLASDGTRLPLRIDYPEPVSRPRPRQLKPGADPSGMYGEMLSAVIRRWLDSSEALPCAELSGGLDSGSVAVAAAGVCDRPLTTLGIVVPGDRGAAQQARRRELCDRFGFHDLLLDARTALPFGLNSRRLRERAVIPWEDCYHEAVEAMLALLPNAPQKLLLNGLGGDELFFPHWSELDEDARRHRLAETRLERERIPEFLSQQTYQIYRDSSDGLDRAPLAPVPTSALAAVAIGSNLYMQHGYWPISPFCAPELVRFCRSLPPEWRADRRLQRVFLANAGCSRQVTHPALKENFNDVMAQGLRAARPLLRNLFQNSRLAATGWLDAGKLLAAYDAYCEGRPPAWDDVHFYAVAVLELTLEALDGQVAEIEPARVNTWA